ncbi:MAG: AAA family ATPase [Anaerolineales bacterium]
MFKFPYGISDFYKVITRGYFFVDRTDHVPLLEEAGEQLVFLRPRRFGKSLLLSMLENYYDVAKADEFDRLFGHLAIGQNPTPSHNQYFILKWDFSGVDTSGDDIETIRRSLHNYINGEIEQFLAYYRHLLDYPVTLHPTDGLRSFQSVLAAVRATPYKLYLMIDEYDNFANEVMMSRRLDSKKRYEALVEGEGVLKTVFKVVKTASTGRGVDRVFITGVSPIVLSDATSGYNVAEHISFNPQFNDLCGFWETEIGTTLEQISSACGFPLEKTTEALTMMRTFYNGYTFCDDRVDLIYNPTLALYFTKYFQDRCQFPDKMLDGNFAMDRAKIAFVSRLPGGQGLVLDTLQEETPVLISQLEDRFGLEEMLNVTEDTRFMASLLYYLGVLTLGERDLESGKLHLQIPNLVVRKLYVEHLQQMFLPVLQSKNAIRRVAERLYRGGEMQAICDFIEQRYFKVFDNRDYAWADELTIKTAFLTILFEDAFYIMDSEPPLERTYADLTMIIRPEMRQYPGLLDILIEFKYVKLAEAGLSRENARQLNLAALKALPAIEEQLEAAKTQAQDYRSTLEAKYGGILRLRTYAVVALGFDRLVWEEIQ